jgi:hypothetical protein
MHLLVKIAIVSLLFSSTAVAYAASADRNSHPGGSFEARQELREARQESREARRQERLESRGSTSGEIRSVPELDAGSASIAVALLLAIGLVFRERRRTSNNQS